MGCVRRPCSRYLHGCGAVSRLILPVLIAGVLVGTDGVIAAESWFLEGATIPSMVRRGTCSGLVWAPALRRLDSVF